MASDKDEPRSGVRVRDAVPRRLGIHKPVHVSGTNPATLPTYVLRDADLAPEDGVRAHIKAAAVDGGFVLLVGKSSVGKTRSLYEAVLEVLPDWWLVQPAPGQYAGLVAGQRRRLVVWLDELQNHLGGEQPLSSATIRSLMDSGAVLAATLWSHYFNLYTAVPSHEELTGGRLRDAMKLADVIHISPDFTLNERRRASVLAESDARIRVGLESPDFGFTQTIAAAPELLDRWASADPYSTAVLTAAIDAARLGVQTPISANLLCAAAPGYCDSADRARAPVDWFDRALAYCTQLLKGATSALIPTADDIAITMGTTDTYRIADYLLQHVGAQRRSSCPPATFWEACTTHLTEIVDVLHIGDYAYKSMRYCYALPLLQRAADAGNSQAALLLGWVLVSQGKTDEALLVMQPFAWQDTGIAETTARLLVILGREDQALEVLRNRAAQPIGPNGGRTWPEWEVVHGRNDSAIRALREDIRYPRVRRDSVVSIPPHTDDIVELKARLSSGDSSNAGKLAYLLAKEGRMTEVVETLQIEFQARGGTSSMPHLYADALTEQGRPDEAMDVLRSNINAGTVLDPQDLAGHLAELLVTKGRLDEAKRLPWLGLTADGEVQTLAGLAALRETLHCEPASSGERDPATPNPIVAAARPRRRPPVIAKLNWDAINAETFERLLFNIVAGAEGYTNAQWLTHTYAPDRGRDVSVERVITDTLGGIKIQRVIVQAKHWRSRSVGRADVSSGMEQAAMWEPPRVQVLVLATSGRFTAEAVTWIERHNDAGKQPAIEMWPESHLEVLLAKRPDLLTEFKLN